MADAANGWEILNTVAQTVGALGTAGALLVAVRVYHRQVEDQRRAQASRVTFVQRDGVVDVSNHSDLPIYTLDITVVVNGASEGPPGRRGDGTRALAPADTFSTTLAPGVITVRFWDAKGFGWTLGDAHSLRPVAPPSANGQEHRPSIAARLRSLVPRRR